MPPRFGSVIIVYYVIAVVMWGGGITAASPGGEVGLGVAEEIVDVNDDEIDVNSSTGEEVQRLGGPIEEAVNSLGGGGLLATWNFIKGLLGALFWPVLVFTALDAPTIVIAFAGVFSMALLVATILVVRGST